MIIVSDGGGCDDNSLIVTDCHCGGCDDYSDRLWWLMIIVTDCGG